MTVPSRVQPTRPQPLWIRYAVTTAIVLVCFLLQVGVQYQSGFFAFFLFVPAIFLAAVLFDRASGFYATFLSTLLSFITLTPSGSCLFVLIGLAMATISEVLRKALENAVAAQQATTLMLDELNHRIRNNLAMITSVLALQARSQKEQAVKDAFASAMGRVNIIANAHEHLVRQDPHASIDMREYLTGCCTNLGDALRDVRPIAVNVDVEDILLRSDKAVAIGMVVNELVTNAFKHAFPGDRAGTVAVSLQRTNVTELALIVEDDGKGCPPRCRREPRLSDHSAAGSAARKLDEARGGQSRLSGGFDHPRTACICSAPLRMSRLDQSGLLPLGRSAR